MQKLLLETAKAKLLSPLADVITDISVEEKVFDTYFKGFVVSAIHIRSGVKLSVSFELPAEAASTESWAEESITSVFRSFKIALGFVVPKDSKEAVPPEQFLSSLDSHRII